MAKPARRHTGWPCVSWKPLPCRLHPLMAAQPLGVPLPLHGTRTYCMGRSCASRVLLSQFSRVTVVQANEAWGQRMQAQGVDFTCRTRVDSRLGTHWCWPPSRCISCVKPALLPQIIMLLGAQQHAARQHRAKLQHVLQAVPLPTVHHYTSASQAAMSIKPPMGAVLAHIRLSVKQSR